MAKYKFKTNPHLGRAIVLDTETTGLSPRMGDKIVELAASEMIDGRLTGNNFHAYINPGIPVPFEATEVHGLTDAFLADMPFFEDIVDDFIGFLGDPGVKSWAHNASFDARFVNAELSYCGHPEMTGFECSLKLARAVFGKGPRDLATLAGMAGLKFGGRGAHSALADTEMLSNVLTQLLWPKEMEIATDPSKAPTPATKAAKSKAGKPAEKPAAPVALPAGFAALTPEDDPRICRYDEVNFDHLITARGKRWTRDEEQGLVDRFIKEGRDVIELVKLHGRTPAALFMKLQSLGVLAEEHPYARPNR